MAFRPSTAGKLVALVMSGFLATACGSATVDIETTTPASESEVAESTDQSSSQSSGLTGQFNTISGESVDLSTYQGQDVVLWFWAPW